MLIMKVSENRRQNEIHNLRKTNDNLKKQVSILQTNIANLQRIKEAKGVTIDKART